VAGHCIQRSVWYWKELPQQWEGSAVFMFVKGENEFHLTFLL